MVPLFQTSFSSEEELVWAYFCFSSRTLSCSVKLSTALSLVSATFTNSQLGELLLPLLNTKICSNEYKPEGLISVPLTPSFKVNNGSTSLDTVHIPFSFFAFIEES